MDAQSQNMLIRYQEEYKRLDKLTRPTMEEGGKHMAYGMIIYLMRFGNRAKWQDEARGWIAHQPIWLWHHDAWGRPYTDLKKAHDFALEHWAQEVASLMI